MVCVQIPICLYTVFVFKYVTLTLHFANRPSCIKVSAFLWKFLQGLNSAVHYLHGSCGRDKIFVAVRVLVVIVALIQVTPKDIYCYSELWTKWWKIYLKYQMNGNIVSKGLNKTYEKGKNHLPLKSEFPYNRPFSLVDFVLSAWNNFRSSDIVRPNFENVRPIPHYDRTRWPNISPAHLELYSSRFCQSINYVRFLQINFFFHKIKNLTN